jgi:uncharacterized protein YdbL (DUF1318 family)
MRQPPVPELEVTPEGGLGRLIETEGRIAAALGAAEAEAAALLEAARRSAETEAGRFGELVDAELSELAASVTAERDAELTRIADANEARCRRLQNLPEHIIEELAGWVAERLLDEGRSGGPP